MAKVPSLEPRVSPKVTPAPRPGFSLPDPAALGAGTGEAAARLGQTIGETVDRTTEALGQIHQERSQARVNERYNDWRRRTNAYLLSDQVDPSSGRVGVFNRSPEETEGVTREAQALLSDFADELSEGLSADEIAIFKALTDRDSVGYERSVLDFEAQQSRKRAVNAIEASMSQLVEDATTMTLSSEGLRDGYNRVEGMARYSAELRGDDAAAAEVYAKERGSEFLSAAVRRAIQDRDPDKAFAIMDRHKHKFTARDYERHIEPVKQLRFDQKVQLQADVIVGSLAETPIADAIPAARGYLKREKNATLRKALESRVEGMLAQRERDENRKRAATYESVIDGITTMAASGTDYGEALRLTNLLEGTDRVQAIDYVNKRYGIGRETPEQKAVKEAEDRINADTILSFAASGEPYIIDRQTNEMMSPEDAAARSRELGLTPKEASKRFWGYANLSRGGQRIGDKRGVLSAAALLQLSPAAIGRLEQAYDDRKVASANIIKYVKAALPQFNTKNIVADRFYGQILRENPGLLEEVRNGLGGEEPNETNVREQVRFLLTKGYIAGHGEGTALKAAELESYGKDVTFLPDLPDEDDDPDAYWALAYATLDDWIRARAERPQHPDAPKYPRADQPIDDRARALARAALSKPYAELREGKVVETGMTHLEYLMRARLLSQSEGFSRREALSDAHRRRR